MKQEFILPTSSTEIHCWLIQSTCITALWRKAKEPEDCSGPFSGQKRTCDVFPSFSCFGLSFLLALLYLISLIHLCDNLWGLKKQDFNSDPTLLMPYCLFWQQLLKTVSAAHIRCHLSLGLDLLPLKSALAKLVTSKGKDLGLWFKGKGGWGPAKSVTGMESYDFLSPVISCYHCARGGSIVLTVGQQVGRQLSF